MHSQNLVVSLQSIKTQKFFKELGGKVYIPEGEEYQIYIKNLSGLKAVVTIDVDGKNAHGSDRFVVNGGQTFTLKGDDKNRAFKFIKKTEKISNYRGDRIDDGLVTISYQFEEPLPEVRTVHTDYGCGYEEFWRVPGLRPFRSLLPPPYTMTTSSAFSGRGSSLGSVSLNNVSAIASTQTFCSTPIPEVSGITVQGSEVEQRFVTAHTRTLQPQVHTIVLQLMIETPAGKPVEKEVTSRSRATCKTCGRRNSSKNKFCSECGTSIF